MKHARRPTEPRVEHEFSTGLRLPLHAPLATLEQNPPAHLTFADLTTSRLTVATVGLPNTRRASRWLARLEAGLRSPHGEGPPIIAVSPAGSSGRRSARSTIASRTVYVDTTGEVAAAVVAVAGRWPTVVVVDRYGNVCWRHGGRRRGGYPPVREIAAAVSTLARMTT